MGDEVFVIQFALTGLDFRIWIIFSPLGAVLCLRLVLTVSSSSEWTSETIIRFMFSVNTKRYFLCSELDVLLVAMDAVLEMNFWTK